MLAIPRCLDIRRTRMIEGKAVIEASSAEGVLFILEGFHLDFWHVSATEPVSTPDGRFVSSVTFSNDRTILEIPPKCG